MDQLEQQLCSLIAGIVEMDEQQVWENRDKHFFKELNLDSLLALEIVAAIEKHYRIEIEEQRLPEIATLSQSIALVRELTAARA
ncbi:MAG: acyl carrier protein [Polyangiaceae bacterium]|nr:acyl carrier protein [Polyangiaceae bacterium]